MKRNDATESASSSKNFGNSAKLVRHDQGVNEDARNNATRLMVWLLCASLIAVGAASSYFAWTYLNESPRFRLSTVDIRGNDRASRAEILRYLALTPEDNIFSVDLDMLRESLMRHPWIKEVAVRRVVPDTVIVDVVEQTPVAIVALSKLYFINDEGETFSRVVLEEAPDLAMLTGLDAGLYAQNREQWNKLTRIGVQLFNVCKRSGLPVAEVELDPQTGAIAHLLPAGTQAHMGFSDFDSKVHHLKDVRALLVERGQSADTFLLDNPRYPDAVVARLNPPSPRNGAFAGVR